MSVTWALSERNSAAVKHPPHTHPVSSGNTIGGSKSPDSGARNVDQCPKAIRVSAVRRPGTAYHGIRPAGAPVASPLYAKSSCPSLSHNRIRVSALMTKRVSSNAVHSGFRALGACHWLGQLPYMFLKNSRCASPLRTACADCASATVCARVHCGSTPAWTISQPWASIASGRWRSQCKRAFRSVASRMLLSVSCGFTRAPVKPTASKLFSLIRN